MGLDAPRVVTPRIDPQVPVFALGRYAGARRRAIVAMKDRGRADLLAPLARSLALGIHRLLLWGLLDVPLTIVPAPTRGWSARHRGGDPVTRIATLATAGHPDITVVRALRMTALARDSAGSEQRRPRTQHLRTSVADPPEYAGRRRAAAGRRHRHDRRHRP